jgi:DNA-binding transcriptional MerR regulator
MSTRSISIKEAAAETRLGSHMRHDERIGLLSIARDANGQRRYNNHLAIAVCEFCQARGCNMRAGRLVFSESR